MNWMEDLEDETFPVELMDDLEDRFIDDRDDLFGDDDDDAVAIEESCDNDWDERFGPFGDDNDFGE